MTGKSLSESQVRALEILRGLPRETWVGSEYRDMRANTLDSLFDRGLVDRRLFGWTTQYRAKENA